MHSPHRTRRILLVALLLLAGSAVVFGPDMLARWLRARSMQVMEQAAGPRSRILIGSVQLELLPGNITWKDLRITQRIDSADSSWAHGRTALISGRIDRIAVKGLSIWRLLTWKTIEMRAMDIRGADLELITSDRRAEQVSDDGAQAKNLINTIRMDSLDLEGRSLRWRNLGLDRPRAGTGRIKLCATGLHAVLPHRHRPFSLSFISATATVDSVKAHFPPLYDLAMARMRIAYPNSMVRLERIALTSRKGPQEYGKWIPYETDLITFTSDSIGLHGLDLPVLLNAHALRATELRASGTKLRDFRDKTLRNAPFKNKPMPARLLRQLPLAVCLDSLVVDNMDVEYNEKAEVRSDFGKLEFTNINAVAHGICTMHPEAKPEVHLVATATVYEQAPVHFDFRTALFDSSDHFSVQARIGPLPFTVFNAMTNDLLRVRATSGSIGGIDFAFEANKNKARGRVDMEYANLKLRIAKRDGSREKAGFKTFLANQLIRSKNLRGSGNFRHGDFSIRRAKDKQVFNYLWRGLREGMLETVLPQVVKDAQGTMSDAKAAMQGK